MEKKPFVIGFFDNFSHYRTPVILTKPLRYCLYFQFKFSPQGIFFAYKMTVVILVSIYCFNTWKYYMKLRCKVFLFFLPLVILFFASL